jgi:hypothetical protein
MTFRVLLAVSLLSSGVAFADGVRADTQTIQQALSRVQELVAQAKAERHPGKLTCAANAEDQIVSLFEAQGATDSATQQAVQAEASARQCIQRHEDPVAQTRTVDQRTMASLDQPLFPAPPDAWFLPPVR